MSNAGYNPYQAPQAPLMAQIVPGSDIWRDGRLIVLRRGAVLPDRCVKCNAPAEGYRLRRNLTWHSPWIYLTIFLGVLIYVIIALVSRQTMTTDVGLCPQHRARRRNGIATAWLLFLCAIGSLYFVFSAKNPGQMQGMFAIASLVLVIISLVVGISTASIVRPKKIDQMFGWLVGVCPEYLAELPQSPVPR